ncbi:MAG: PD-(D/E)XK nuclease family protein [Bacteroidaceae bacterium]|nr:PD-(D/E)XK nuclease family protein [Bacteroidaceae bacterium]
MRHDNTPFLQLVASDLYTRFDGQLRDIAIVFPNKRAGLFFNEYLMNLSGRPMWSPTYITISELFEQCSSAIIGDPILLVSKLYKEYTRHTHSSETIDSFFHWGELMIKDFDDIDKNLADTGQLFGNLNELRSIGSASDALDSEQRLAIEQFFTNFKPQERSELKSRFLHVWQVMGDIYTTFKEQLRSEGIAYEGMLYRDIIEKGDTLPLPHRKYIFVGFNALNRVESKLFETVDKSQKALFYWDYDTSYTNDERHEAGRFMRRNLTLFANALDESHFTNIRDKKINIVSATTDSIQMRYASEWIKEHTTTGKEVETALILCDESKLESVYHIIPDNIRERNITMGFPVSHTPIFDLVKQLIKLQTQGYDKEHGTFTLEAVSAVLNHPYIRKSSPMAKSIAHEISEKRVLFPPLGLFADDALLQNIFTLHDDNTRWMLSIGEIIHRIAQTNNSRPAASEPQEREADIYNELFLEAQLKVFTQTQRLVDILGSGLLEIQKNTLGSLLLRLLSSTSIPFHGEPVVGMQVMGLLETRNLDFKNIIFLSANEGNLPKASSESSFIPYNLRRAFGLTLSEHRDSIYAYNFYRLLQRAENITIVYNSSAEGSGRGGCSRYILQLMAGGQCANKISLCAQQKSDTQHPATVVKNKEIMERLHKIYDNSGGNGRPLSPSAINSYLDCPLRFYYRYVMQLKKSEQLSATIQGNDFGLIFHKAAELFYAHIQEKNNGTIERGDLLPYIQKDALLYPFVDKAFNEEYFKSDEKPIYDGEQYMNREIIHRLLKRLVKMDISHTPFEYVGSEQDIFFDYTVATTQGNIQLRIGGRIDRMDRKDGTLEIIDYKTGGKEERVNNLTQIFTHETKNSGYVFQTLLYCVAAIESKKATKASPSLIYIHRKDATNRNDYIVKIAGKPLYDTAPLCSEFKEHLHETLGGIFDEALPFTPTDKEERCTYCDFKRICGR